MTARTTAENCIQPGALGAKTDRWGIPVRMSPAIASIGVRSPRNDGGLSLRAVWLGYDSSSSRCRRLMWPRSGCLAVCRTNRQRKHTFAFALGGSDNCMT